MKTEYFNSENIDETAGNLISELRLVRNRQTFELQSSKSALLVLDMQEYFLRPESHAYIPSSKVITQRIDNLVRLFREIDRPIFFTRHMNDSTNSKLMSVWWKDLIKSENPMSEIDDCFIYEGMIVVDKSQYDAFYQTDLERILHDKGIEQLIVCGVMTHLCCETTIRSAFVRGFECFFPTDTTATYNFEQHRATFINLTHGFAIPTLSSTIIKELK